VKLTAR